MSYRSVSYRGFAMLLVFLVSALPAVGQAAPPQQEEPPALHLKAATFAPGRGQAPAIPPGLTVAGYAQGQRGYYIIQFHGPVEQAWKDEVSSAGAELLAYIPDFAFKARMNPAEAARIERLGSVAWVGLFQPAYKLSPDLVRDGTHLYRVRVERGADAGQATAAIAQAGAQVLDRQESILLVAADAAQLTAIAQVLDVAWVENFRMPQKHNEYGAGVIIGANAVNANGYDGSTQIAAVADTGLGNGTASGAHPDLPASRITAIYNWPGSSNNCYSVINDGAADVDSGHGTHVALSVLGGGYLNQNNIRVEKGTAPAARLVFQAVENFADMKGLCAFSYPDDYYLIGLPNDLRLLYQQAYDAGARIHSNSWGSAVNGDYTLDSANTDDFIWNRRDMLITFSAGNEGTDANANGVVDNDSIGSPATAKNVLTVGASENDRQGHYECDTNLLYVSQDAAYQQGQTCGSMGGQNLLGTYGQRWPADYPANPVAGDPTGGNKEQMAAFSSRGPTDDSRIKPDVVAPGTWVLAGYADPYQQGYDGSPNPRTGRFQHDGWGMPLNQYYKYFGGTSMSNPLAAGAATVVRDFYQKAHNHAASAALVKATLINSALDLLDENNDGADDNAFPIPNVHEGWGRINLLNATDGSSDFVDQTTGIATGANREYSVNVAGGSPLKITLVWSDYASTEAASINLVNDLDLVVTAPGGALYRGNVFSGGWSQTGGSADRRNNVENVYVAVPVSGAWTVRVTGFNVPNGPQPFALVVDGGDLAAPPPPGNMHLGGLTGSSTPAAGGKWHATVTITVHDSNHNGVANATVNGTWSNGASGSGSCTTNSSGQCTISKNNINKNVSSVQFTVSGVTHATFVYAPSANDVGTSVTINSPGSARSAATEDEEEAAPQNPLYLPMIGR